MNRYKFSKEKKTELGKRYFGSIMYPEIKIRNNEKQDIRRSFNTCNFCSVGIQIVNL